MGKRAYIHILRALPLPKSRLFILLMISKIRNLWFLNLLYQYSCILILLKAVGHDIRADCIASGCGFTTCAYALIAYAVIHYSRSLSRSTL